MIRLSFMQIAVGIVIFAGLGIVLGFEWGAWIAERNLVRRLLRNPKLGAGYYAVADEAERLGISPR